MMQWIGILLTMVTAIDMETVVPASTHNHCTLLRLAKYQKYLPAQYPFLLSLGTV